MSLEDPAPQRINGINVLREISEQDKKDPLDPESIARDAAWLLEHNTDHQHLVCALLKQLREHRRQEEAIRDGYGSSYRTLRAEYDQVVDERNVLVTAMRTVKRATRNIRVGRE